jgi:plastocyanin
MPFTWRINIRKNPQRGGPAIFEFEETPQVNVGDLIFWSNDDTVPHWPCEVGNQSAFMTNQIAAKSTSPSFAPGQEGTITYICSLHPGETGVIDVLAPKAPAAPSES